MIYDSVVLTLLKNVLISFKDVIMRKNIVASLFVTEAKYKLPS
jgi:hypothetical protein